MQGWYASLTHKYKMIYGVWDPNPNCPRGSRGHFWCFFMEFRMVLKPRNDEQVTPFDRVRYFSFLSVSE